MYFDDKPSFQYAEQEFYLKIVVSQDIHLDASVSFIVHICCGFTKLLRR